MTEKIELTIIDEAGAKETKIRVPVDWPVSRVINSFVSKAGLPTVGSDGQPVSYHLVLKRENIQLDDSQTLDASGVKDGDVLRLVTTIIPGSRID